MRQHRLAHVALSTTLALAALLPVACGDAGLTTSSNGGAGNDGVGAGTIGGGGSGGGTGGDLFGANGQGAGTLQPLTVSPASAQIEVVDGVAAPVDFNAMRGFEEVPASWIVDLSSVATVDAQGTVSAVGTLGGDVVVTASDQGETATASVTVKLSQTYNPAGVSGGDQSILLGAVDGDPSIVWQYPYDATVFPRGVYPPELMWQGGGVDDTYLVRLTSPYVDVKIFTKADPPSRHLIDPAAWEAVTESGNGGPITMRVSRLTPGAQTATVAVEHTWTVASGSLRGTVYYWANNIGRVLRIKPGEGGAPEDFLANAGISYNCSTCHSVSADGSTLIIGGDINESTFDLLTNAPILALPSVGKPVRNWAMPAISPDGNILVENNAPLPGPPGGSDAMWNAKTGQKLVGGGLDGVLLDMPAFAPDGTKLAYVDHNTLGLGVYDFDMATATASNPVALVPEGGVPRIAFPSVSPDAKWVVYHRGVLDTRYGTGDLYLASIEQPGVEIPLDALNGSFYPFAAGDRDRHWNYEPTFAPLAAGGYFWVVFTTRRTYGNRLTGGKDAVKQLWVAAIDQNPQPGVDPSHPAFLVPGQDLATWNMRGYWALDPCKEVGEGCATGSECCNQNCDMGICSEPDPNECSANGNHCDTNADCCDPQATCINHICSEPPPA